MDSCLNATLKNKAVSSPSTRHIQQQLDGGGHVVAPALLLLHAHGQLFQTCSLLHDKTYTIFPPA
jgi:hypothetical protein